MNTAAELTSTVSALGREVPIWVFLVVAVLLALGGVAALLVRPGSASSTCPSACRGNCLVRRGRRGVPPTVRRPAAGGHMTVASMEDRP